MLIEHSTTETPYYGVLTCFAYDNKTGKYFGIKPFFFKTYVQLQQWKPRRDLLNYMAEQHTYVLKKYNQNTYHRRFTFTYI